MKGILPTRAILLPGMLIALLCVTNERVAALEVKEIVSAPFSLVYNVSESSGAKFKRYVWSNGKGVLRSENQLPYATLDGITDVVFEDYNNHVKSVITCLFMSMEKQPLGPFLLPLTLKDFSPALNAKSLGTKTIGGFSCVGFNFKRGNLSNEIWISPQLKWFLEHKITEGNQTTSIKLEKISDKPPPADLFVLPQNYKIIDNTKGNEQQQHHHPGH